MIKKLTVLLTTLFLLCACSPAIESNGKLSVVTTTTMITDLVNVIAQDTLNIHPLMQSGIDPHSYKAKESDVMKLIEADLVIYNGVHLEAKLVEIFDSLDNTVSLESGLSKEDILLTDEGGQDPHIWFSINNWKKAAQTVSEALIELNPKDSNIYTNNLNSYLKELDSLQSYITNKVSQIPQEKRILVTAHDAFNYFAQTNGFTVMAIQGISTEAEASTNTLSQLADFIAKFEIKSIFTESSISPKTVEALKEAVNARGFEVAIGPELYSDSLKINASYIETYTENINSIVDSLK